MHLTSRTQSRQRRLRRRTQGPSPSPGTQSSTQSSPSWAFSADAHGRGVGAERKQFHYFIRKPLGNKFLAILLTINSSWCSLPRELQRQMSQPCSPRNERNKPPRSHLHTSSISRRGRRLPRSLTPRLHCPLRPHPPGCPGRPSCCLDSRGGV